MAVPGSFQYRIQNFSGTDDQLQALIQECISEIKSIGGDLRTLRAVLVSRGHFVQFVMIDGDQHMIVSKKPIKKSIQALRGLIHDNSDTTSDNGMTLELIKLLIHALNAAFIIEKIQRGKMSKRVMQFNLSFTPVAHEV